MINHPLGGPAVPKDFEFHHLGYATTSIEKEKAFFASLGFRQEGDAFEDAVQGIAGCFMIGAGPRIELLENLPGAATLTPWLTSRIKIYHFAYVVNDLAKAIEWARDLRGKVTVPPVPAIAFAQREISFVMFASGLMVEFVTGPGGARIRSSSEQE